MLKVVMVYLISFIVLIILATIIFILTLQNKRKLFGIFSTILIIAPVIINIVSRHFSKLDYIAHPNLALNNNTLLVFFIGVSLSILFGLVNVILAFTKRSDEMV